MSHKWLHSPDCKVFIINNVWQVQKMHEAQETSASASEQRSAKRRKTSPEVPAAKKKPAVSKSTWYTLTHILFFFSCLWSTADASASDFAVMMAHVTDPGCLSLLLSTVPCPQRKKALLGASFVF